ncbi:hypothetical protein ABDK00_007655 [Niabella insulamsoli]|uniref:hypothetical protein n=1 Tax=Niabella insulamsoli TaxID=3144874 RepID=UPI0031FE13F4
MNLISLLERPYTKAQANDIVNWIGNDQKRFDALLKIFLSEETLLVQRASWPLSYCVANHPRLINKHYDRLINYLKATGKPAAIRRNILRAFDQLDPIPENYHGELMDACFGFIEDPNEAIASQAFALGILSKFAKIYPEIKPELLLIVEDRFPNAPPAFRSRAKKLLRKN